MEMQIVNVVYEGPSSSIAPQYDLEALWVMINSPRPKSLMLKSSVTLKK